MVHGAPLKQIWWPRPENGFRINWKLKDAVLQMCLWNLHPILSSHLQKIVNKLSSVKEDEKKKIKEKLEAKFRGRLNIWEASFRNSEILLFLESWAGYCLLLVLHPARPDILSAHLQPTGLPPSLENEDPRQRASHSKYSLLWCWFLSASTHSFILQQIFSTVNLQCNRYCARCGTLKEPASPSNSGKIYFLSSGIITFRGVYFAS